tara:strand:+ start:745 stop:1818 length:1074 start_codon:yes stop_codon:yes gene_type:complete
MTPREERKARNVYNESLRRAQAGDTSSYVQGEMKRYGISDPSAASFRGSGSGNLNQSIDTGKNYIGGLWGGAQRGLDALTQGVAMANENERWFKQNAPNAKLYAGVPMNVRESVQTDRDKNFFNKYMNLAAMAQDSDKKQWYLDQADTARRNLQITKRINYGLGQMDLDETPFKGYESYDQGFEGFGSQDLGPRFDIDKFTEAMSEYLPGGEDITEDITETIRSPHDIETETIAETPLEAVDRTDDWWYTPPFDDEVTITDLPIEEDITETIIEDDGEKFVLKESKFDLGNLGVGNEYSPNVDLNIMNIKDSELRKKATEAALMFHQAYTEGEGGKYYGQMEDFWQAYLDAVEAGAQ